MKLCLLLGLIGLFSSPTLSAQFRITRIETALPTTETPPYALYENVNGRWYAKYPRGPELCKDVSLTFTTEANRTYYVETGCLELPRPWEIGRPNHQVLVWQQCSLPITGTGQPYTWHGGGGYSYAVYRIRQ